MIFGMWDEVLFHLGPIPVDHLVVTEWVLIALIGTIAYLATRNMQLVPADYKMPLKQSSFGPMIFSPN